MADAGLLCPGVTRGVGCHPNQQHHARRLPLEAESAALGAALQAAACHLGIPVRDFVQQHPPPVAAEVRFVLPTNSTTCTSYAHIRLSCSIASGVGAVLHVLRTLHSIVNICSRHAHFCLAVFAMQRCCTAARQVILPDPDVKEQYAAAYQEFISRGQQLFGAGQPPAES